MSLSELPIGVFDLLLAGTLVGGFYSGRRHGMSQEALGTAQWVMILLGSATAYGQVGRGLAEAGPGLSLLSCYIIAYIICAVAIAAFFVLVRRALGGKLVGSDVFGRSEYYLGMAAGTVRYACMLLAALAVLNARAFNPAEVHAWDKQQRDELGNDFFPTLYTLQTAVFDRSLTGSWIKGNLGFLLIERTAAEHKEFHLKEIAL